MGYGGWVKGKWCSLATPLAVKHSSDLNRRMSELKAEGLRVKSLSEYKPTKEPCLRQVISYSSKLLVRR